MVCIVRRRVSHILMRGARDGSSVVCSTAVLSSLCSASSALTLPFWLSTFRIDSSAKWHIYSDEW
jgi:hypothetical protein